MDKFTSYNVAPGVNFNVIKDGRFKTGRASVALFRPLDDAQVCANAVLPFLLSKSCSKYKDFTSIHRYLDELYGASVGADVSKLGEIQVLSISSSFLADDYALSKEKISEKITNLLCEMLFDPIIVNGAFSTELLDQEKRQLVDLIESEFNDKRIYSKNKCQELMCEGERFGINKYGTKSGVEGLSEPEVFEIWKENLKSSRIELTLLGNVKDHQFALDAFRNKFKELERTNIKECKTEIIRECKSVRNFAENISLSQSKLVMGFRTGIAGKDKNTMAMRLAVAIFGATPHCKLFLNVREKYSLCYYCSAKYDRHKGIMLVESGVESKNIERAKEEILNQLNDVKKGNFTDDDINNIKRSLSNMYRTIGDYLSSIESFYVSQIFDENKLSTDEFIEKLDKVTKEEIVDAANKIYLDTVYTLVGTGEEV